MTVGLRKAYKRIIQKGIFHSSDKTWDLIWLHPFLFQLLY